MTKTKDVLGFALEASRKNFAVEFGVGQGGTLKRIAPCFKRTVGFDSFQGLPETWRVTHPKGMFACPVPVVPRAELVTGLFENAAMGFDFSGVDFVHIDCDLYSSTKTALAAVKPYLQSGTVLAFDEIFGYEGWEDHEHKALQESQLVFDWLCVADEGEQAAVVIL